MRLESLYPLSAIALGLYVEESVTASHKDGSLSSNSNPFAPLSGRLNSPSFDLSSRKESMELAASLIELVNNIWGLARQPLGYIRNLRGNVTSLRKEAEDLNDRSRDVEESVLNEERGGGVQRTNKVVTWLRRVREFEGRVGQVLEEAEKRDRIRCLSRCLPQNCWSSYRLGETVDQMLNKAKTLLKDGEFSILTLPLSSPPVIPMSMGKTVGLEATLNKVWEWLVDEKGGVIGLYGVGGVGKSTLMKMINNNLLVKNHRFEIVIWVEVSKMRHGKCHEENAEDSIQDPITNKEKAEDSIPNVIRKRLGIKDETWENWTSRSSEVHDLLSQVLEEKNFLLLIDDVLGKLDLSKIGVPLSPKSGSKVVFTTRSVEVCILMGAKNTSLRVECLTTERALELFENSVGQSLADYNPVIQDLANDIVNKCAGLPLALTIVGKAMAGITKIAEWEYWLSKLQKSPEKVPGMEKEVYSPLKLSYDRLDDPTLQRCFLYCCLFPEDYHIRPHDLIGLWIGEGLLGDTANLNDLRNVGEIFLGRLNRVYLLESGYDSKGNFVKMHGVIHHMATWIARNDLQRKNMSLMMGKQEDLSEEMISKWVDAEKVSMWGKWIQNIDQIPHSCPRLKTLILRETSLKLLPIGYFDSMVAHLMVLDLSNNSDIQSFPEDICSMINLRYLNLSATGIQELPWAIEKLAYLRWLLLDDLKKINLNSMGAITSLPLKVLSMWRSLSMVETGMVEKLERMRDQAELSIRVTESSSAKEIFRSLNLRKRLRRAEIFCSFDLTSIEIHQSPTGNGNFSCLETLSLFKCYVLETMETQGIRPTRHFSYFPSLVDVEISYCGFSNLSWLVHVPKLRELKVRNCSWLEKIIGDGFEPDELADFRLLSCLESISLSDIPNLTSICDQALSFQQGVKFRISQCPGLRRLPLDWNKAGGGRFSVEGDRQWWTEFEWDPAAQVTVRLDETPIQGEMTYAAAQDKIEAEFPNSATIEFLPRGPSEQGP